MKVEERHEREQYFWNQPTIDYLAEIVSRFVNPCLLCAPMLGVEMSKRKKAVTVLDIDERFASVPGFRRWDVYRPGPLDTKFDLIVCDPPFFRVSLSHLFTAIRLLAQFDLTTKILIGYLDRREAAFLGTFAPFGMLATDKIAGYKTVQRVDRNIVRLYSNFDLPH